MTSRIPESNTQARGPHHLPHLLSVTLPQPAAGPPPRHRHTQARQTRHVRTMRLAAGHMGLAFIVIIILLSRQADAAAEEAAATLSRTSPVTGVNYRHKLFFDDFARFDAWTGPGSRGKWRTSFAWGPQGYNPHRPSEYGAGRGGINGERQWYTDDSFGTVEVGTPSGVVNCLRIRVVKRNVTGFDGTVYPYSSGMITSQQFARLRPPVWIEGRFRIPSGIGLWPAFWLYNLDGTTDEIDGFELSGAPTWRDGRGDISPHEYTTFSAHHGADKPASVYVKTGARTYNTLGEPDPVSKGRIADLVVPDATADFFTYAIEWRSDRITAYVNGKVVWQYTTGPTDPDRQQSHLDAIPNPRSGMYLIVTLTANGSEAFREFVGDANDNADLATNPAFLDIDYLAAWRP